MAVPPSPSAPANMSLTNSASPHCPTQLSYAQALASPGRQHKEGSSTDETRTKLSLSEAPLAKVANLYNCPSCRRATFSDDANETQTFSGADENPWDGYNFALDDESASEEDPTSKDEAGARTGEKAKDVARSLIGASFYHPDIDAHEQQLRADTVVDGTDHTPSCSTPAVARTATDMG
jgi:hypothetical protein